MGTKQGLFLFDPSKETFSHVNLNGKSREEDDTSINYIMEDPDGNIWLGCYGQGIYVLSPTLKVLKHYVNRGRPGDIASNYVWCIVQDYGGVIWIGTDGGGLVRLDPKEEKFTSVMDRKDLGLTDPTIYSLYCDMDNTIWVGTSVSGLYRCNFRTGKVTGISYPGRKILSIKAITEYSNNELVMGCDAGLIRVNRVSEQISFINEGSAFDNITDKSIFSIAHDTEGGLWVGTYFGGVNYYLPMPTTSPIILCRERTVPEALSATLPRSRRTRYGWAPRTRACCCSILRPCRSGMSIRRWIIMTYSRS